MSEIPDSEEAIVVYFDGLCEPKNPGGVATYGFLIIKSGKKIHHGHGLADAKPWTNEASNNVAEYSALIHALEWLLSENYNQSPVIIRGDSKLIINQITGIFKVKAFRIIELHEKAMNLMSNFPRIRAEWVARSENKEADLLSRIAYSKFIKARRKE